MNITIKRKSNIELLRVLCMTCLVAHHFTIHGNLYLNENIFVQHFSLIFAPLGKMCYVVFDGIRQIWHDARLRGRGYSRAEEILQYAKASVGIKDGTIAGKAVVKWFVQKIMELDAELAVIEKQINQKCQEIPYAGNILEILGIGENTLSGILAEMGDISRFDDVKGIQKLSGLGLVACSSGKHKGETKISHRGRKRLRYWLFQAAKSAVAHAEEVKELHVYYTTRPDNPLKKMQSLIVIACKLLRIVYTILKKGMVYDPKKMLMDIRRPEKKEAIAA